MKKGVQVNLVNDIKDFIKGIIFSRMFVLLLVFIVMFYLLVQKLFVLQIVNGESYVDNFELKIKKEKTLKSTRGNIFDRNGELLAYNELAYSVTIEDLYESGKGKNEQLNDTILRTCKLVEKNGDKVINDFNVILDNSGQFSFSVEGTSLTRFLADIYGYKKTSELKYSEKNATPEDVIEYMGQKFAIGEYKDPEDKDSFVVGEGYTKEELLQIMTIRYLMNNNGYQKYLSTTIAKDVNEKTVATIMENKDMLLGVDISEDTLRKYIDSEYFSHVLGYTGNVSTEELEKLVKENDAYTLTDMVGKTGIEQVEELALQGNKGKEVLYVDNLGKVIKTSERVEPTAGNDIYLTIDKELQKAVYDLIEQKLAGILVSRIDNVKEINRDVTSSKLRIPIDDVYFAILNNNIVDIGHFSSPNAKSYEKEIYTKLQDKQSRVISALMTELNETSTPYNQLSTEMQVYESYITTMLNSANKGVIITSEVDSEDEVYLDWKAEKISLKEYLNHAIAKNWIDISKFELETRYSDSTQIYDELLKYIENELEQDNGFAKKMYRYMIRDNELTGKEICMVMFEQAVIYGTASEKASLESGGITAYNYLMDKIKKLDLTPAQLALDPCSASCVVTATNGEVLACVTYPGYDNNKMANSIDSAYYNKLREDLSLPLYDYATQQRTAPGSTFKMVSSVAGLEEGVIDTSSIITCHGVYDKVKPSPKCWINPGAHGDLNVVGGITNSCNSFFYEVGYRLSTDLNNTYQADLGLEKLAKYADMFGLSDTSGIEIVENDPKVSDELPILSAIGQGTNNYTIVGIARYVNTVANGGTCYNLTLLSKETDSEGNLLKTFTPTVRNQVQIKESTWNAVHQGMRGVVQNAAVFDKVPMAIAGKTGTAQEKTTRANHALFVGYAPYEDPQITIATRIAFGYTSSYAAEISRDVIKYYFKLEDSEVLLNGEASEVGGAVIED